MFIIFSKKYYQHNSSLKTKSAGKDDYLESLSSEKEGGAATGDLDVKGAAYGGRTWGRPRRRRGREGCLGIFNLGSG